MTILYCIRHETMVHVELNDWGMGHTENVPIGDYPYYEIDFCDFEDGWATTPPPEIDMDEYIKFMEAE